MCLAVPLTEDFKVAGINSRETSESGLFQKVNNLDALDLVVVPNLIQLGRQHALISGFKVEYLDAFRMAMIDVWKEELGRERFAGETHTAWAVLFLLVTNSVFDGYRQRSSELNVAKPSTGEDREEDEIVDSVDGVTIDSASAEIVSESRDFDDETA